MGSLAAPGETEIKAQCTRDFPERHGSLGAKRRAGQCGQALAEVAAGLWCTVGCLIAVVSVHRRKSGDLGWQRKRERAARPEPQAPRGPACRGRGRFAGRASGRRSAVIGLIADMRNIVALGLTASEVDAALAKTAVPGGMRKGCCNCFEAIESAEYGSGIASEIPAMIAAAEGLIPSLARHLERNGARDAMRRIVPALIALIRILPGDAVAAEPGSRERTFIRALEVFDSAKTPSDYRESASRSGISARRRVSERCGLLQSGECVLPGGEYGRSIAAYRKAKFYRPRDSYLEANLRQALAAAPGHLREPPAPGGGTCCSGAAGSRFPRRSTHHLSAICWRALAACLAALFRWPRSVLVKRGNGRMWHRASVSIPPLAYAEITRSPHGVVTSGNDRPERDRQGLRAGVRSAAQGRRRIHGPLGERRLDLRPLRRHRRRLAAAGAHGGVVSLRP